MKGTTCQTLELETFVYTLFYNFDKVEDSKTVLLDHLISICRVSAILSNLVCESMDLILNLLSNKNINLKRVIG